MSENAMAYLQLAIFVLLGGATFLVVWVLAGFVAEKPDKVGRDIQEAVDQMGQSSSSTTDSQEDPEHSHAA